ncbi:MAG: dephospho-CoA kinase [Saprospiraceae bacterium]
MKSVGITGGIGSGKSMVATIFASLGIPIYNADIRAKEILASNLTVKRDIKALLGDGAYFKNGKPNRKYIAKLIFNDKTLLQAINAIVHPAVQVDSERWIEQQKKSKTSPYVIKEAALLVENGSYRALDALIVVVCPEKERIRRVVHRDKTKEDEVRVRIKNQLPDDDKIAVADFVILNDGITPLIPQIIEIHDP